MTAKQTPKAVETSEAEATAPPPKRVWQWSTQDGQEITLAIPRRIKRGKLARKFSQGDMFGALELVFTEAEIEQIEELDLTSEEWDDFQERLVEAITGAAVPKT